jgi:hypothetical protein
MLTLLTPTADTFPRPGDPDSRHPGPHHPSTSLPAPPPTVSPGRVAAGCGRKALVYCGDASGQSRHRRGRLCGMYDVVAGTNWGNDQIRVIRPSGLIRNIDRTRSLAAGLADCGSNQVQIKRRSLNETSQRMSRIS